ncbi:MAG: mercury(II) reductase [Candidatus Aminicenantia bacterium]
MKKYDLVIIGGGAAGFAAAIKASEFEVKIAMIEAENLGGICVNVGCVPTKHLLAVGYLYKLGKLKRFEGIGLEQKFLDFRKVIEQKEKLINELRKEKYINVANDFPNVDIYKEKAQFISKNQVKVGKEILQAEKFIIATGSSPNILKIRGIEKVEYLTNVEALTLKKLPKSLLIIGGRALSLEFAQMYNNFGTKVTILQRSKRIIPDEEPEISLRLKEYLEFEGIGIHTNVQLKNIEQRGNEKLVTVMIEGKEREFKGDQLLMATGRRPNTSQLGLEKAGVKVGQKNGAILTNEKLETTANHIWAAGDVRGIIMLETVAAKEGFIAANNALSNKKLAVDFHSVPHAIFTDPQVASVGLTDEKAVQQGYQCKCRVLDMSLVPKASVISDTRGLIKMVIDAKTDRILGVHILSPLAADVIHEAILTVKFKMTIDDIIDTVHIFPTLSESIKLVAQSFRKDISKLSCCVE